MVDFVGSQSIFSGVTEHVTEKILTADVTTNPFTYMYIKEIFPENFYNELLQRTDRINFNDLKSLIELGNVRDSYSDRRKVLMVRQYWNKQSSGFQYLEASSLKPHDKIFFQSLYWWFFHVFEPLLIKKLKLKFEKKCDALMIAKDGKDYQLGPHPDSPDKIVTSLFYLAKNNNNPQLGTTIHKKIVDNPEEWKWDDYQKIGICEYIPNSVMIFVRSYISYHAVEPIYVDSERTILHHIVKGKKI